MRIQSHFTSCNKTKLHNIEKRSCIEQTGTDFLGGYGHLSTRSYALFKCRLKNVPLKQSLFSREEYPVYKN